MKVGLINLYSSQNIGDAAIYAAFKHLLYYHQLSALISVEQQNLIHDLSVESEQTRCDAYISVGGDIFNNARPWLITRTFLNNIRHLQRQPQRTIVFGQSIPRSTKGLAFRQLCRTFKTLASVTVRDEESWKRLTAAGVNAQLSYDLAFLHQPTDVAKDTARAVLASHHLPPERTVLISLRQFDAMYPHDNKRFADDLVALCQQLTARGLKPALLIQSDAEGSDQVIAHDISQKTGAIPLIDALNHPQNLKPHQFLQGLLAISGLAVGVRFHTSVLAMAAGRMPFNLYYSNKGQDLCNRLAVPGCSVADFQPHQGISPVLECVGRPFNARVPRQNLLTAWHNAMAGLSLPTQQQAA